MPVDYSQFWSVTREDAPDRTDSGHHGQAFWEWGESVASWLMGIIPREATSVLDYGCAIGRMIKHINVPNPIGVDVAQSRLDLASEYAPHVKFILGDGRSIPVEDESVDFVYSFQVLQHLDAADVPPILADTYRILKPGGSCYHTFSMFGQAWSETATMHRTRGPGAEGCLNYSIAVVTSLAENAGFTKFDVFEVPRGVDWNPGPYSYAVLKGVKVSEC